MQSQVLMVFQERLSLVLIDPRSTFGAGINPKRERGRTTMVPSFSLTLWRRKWMLWVHPPDSAQANSPTFRIRLNRPWHRLGLRGPYVAAFPGHGAADSTFRPLGFDFGRRFGDGGALMLVRAGEGPKRRLGTIRIDWPSA